MDADDQTRVLVAAPTPALRAGPHALLAGSNMRITAETATLAERDDSFAGIDIIVVADIRFIRVRPRRILHRRYHPNSWRTRSGSIAVQPVSRLSAAPT